MTKSQLLERIGFLRDIQAWSLEHNRGLTEGERICISQERAALMNLIDGISNETATYYAIPFKLEEKVQGIARVIYATGWERQD